MAKNQRIIAQSKTKTKNNTKTRNGKKITTKDKRLKIICRKISKSSKLKRYKPQKLQKT